MKHSCAIIAGEPSADLIGKDVISCSCDEINWFGVGGPLMQNEGFLSIYDWKKIKAFGIFDIVFRIPSIIFSLIIISNILIKKKPRLIVTVDTKGFNFLLIRILKYRCKKLSWKPKIVHIVAPTVWAWRSYRSKSLKGLVDKLICLFPKEPKYFTVNGIDAKFCGHPAVERLEKIKLNKKQFYQNIGISEKSSICAILPGSRSNEIKRILPILLDFTLKIQKEFKTPPVFIIPMATNQEKIIFDLIKTNINVLTVENVVFGDFLMKNADIAIVTSGTATLEYALCGVPTIAVYKTGYFSAFVGRRIIDMSKIILPNWILNENLIKFLFQEDLNYKNLCIEFQKLFNKKDKKFYYSSKKLNNRLKSNNISFKENIYKEILSVLKKN